MLTRFQFLENIGPFHSASSPVASPLLRYLGLALWSKDDSRRDPILGDWSSEPFDKYLSIEEIGAPTAVRHTPAPTVIGTSTEIFRRGVHLRGLGLLFYRVRYAHARIN